MPDENTITRTMEYGADMYGLNAARQPDGEANVMLGEYRKLDPGPVDELKGDRDAQYVVSFIPSSSLNEIHF